MLTPSTEFRRECESLAQSRHPAAGFLILIPSCWGFGSKFLEFIAIYRGEVDGAFAVAPILNYLLASTGFLLLFFWAAMNGMFHDIERPKYTMLENEKRLGRTTVRPRSLKPWKLNRPRRKPNINIIATREYNSLVRAIDLDRILVLRRLLHGDLPVPRDSEGALFPAMTGDRSRPEVCAYCGLPLDTAAARRGEAAAPPTAGNAPAATPHFCCFGCRFAYAVASEGGAEGAARWTMTRLGISVFLTMNVMMFTMALWTEDIYDPSDLATPAAVSLHGLLRYLCLLLSLPVLLMLGGPLLENAVHQARRGQYSADLLIVLGVLASFVYSVISVVRDQGHVYFEVGCVVLTAVTLGRWFEAMAKIRATRSLQALARLLPDQVRRRGEDGALHRVPLETVQSGDLLRIGPGERIPVDGILVRGSAAIDQQVVTGESELRIHEAGDPILSGSLNVDGDLWVQAAGPAREGTLQRLAAAVQQAAESRGTIQQGADRIARWFVPLTIGLAAATFVYWYTQRGLEDATLTALAVVLIACPCAIGIATPLAIWACLGRASAAQVLIRQGDALPELARCRTICFDKTGTLTTSRAEWVDLAVDHSTHPEEVWHVARSVAGATRHVLADSLRQQARAAGRSAAGANEWAARNAPPGEEGREPHRPAIDVLSARTTPGRGVRAELSPPYPVVFLGSRRWMQEQGQNWSPELSARAEQSAAEGFSQLAVGWDGTVRGLFLFREQVRTGAEQVLDWLSERGMRVVILTGDHTVRARQVAEPLGVEVHAALLPEAKLELVRQWQREGTVVMVGDGFNDAPALAQADVSLALRCGADLARETADICLLGDHLERIPWLIGLAQRTRATIRQNLFWAFAYNVVGVGLAACGLLHPALAAMAMVVSSVKVVANSLQIGRFEDPRWPGGQLPEFSGERGKEPALPELAEETGGELEGDSESQGGDARQEAPGRRGPSTTMVTSC
jgi:heavy metal translocating P-type ATPase